MIVDRAWVERNRGFDPITTPAPASTFAFAAAVKSPSGEDLRREMIDFDSEAPSGREFLAFTTATGLSRYTDVPWPKGLAPKTGSPTADIVFVSAASAWAAAIKVTIEAGVLASRETFEP